MLLASVLEILDASGINIDYMYEIRGNRRHITAEGTDMQLFVFKVSDNSKAIDAFEAEGIKVFGQGELSAL